MNVIQLWGAVPKIWHCILPLRAACSHSRGADLHIVIITIMNSVITSINAMRVMHRNIPTTEIATTTVTSVVFWATGLLLPGTLNASLAFVLVNRPAMIRPPLDKPN